jgi:hypothetical protein
MSYDTNRAEHLQASGVAEVADLKGVAQGPPPARSANTQGLIASVVRHSVTSCPPRLARFLPTQMTRTSGIGATTMTNRPRVDVQLGQPSQRSWFSPSCCLSSSPCVRPARMPCHRPINSRPPVGAWVSRSGCTVALAQAIW